MTTKAEHIPVDTRENPRRFAFRYEWTCGRCGAVEMCEPELVDIANNRETRPPGWKLIKIDQAPMIVCRECAASIEQFLRKNEKPRGSD